MILLKDTVELMNSEDYKERFKAEYYQLKIRYERLKKFVHKIEAVRIHNREYGFDIMKQIVEPKHDCPLEMLKDQIQVMKEYLEILEIRAELEGVNL